MTQGNKDNYRLAMGRMKDKMLRLDMEIQTLENKIDVEYKENKYLLKQLRKSIHISNYYKKVVLAG